MFSPLMELPLIPHLVCSHMNGRLGKSPTELEHNTNCVCLVETASKTVITQRVFSPKECQWASFVLLQRFTVWPSSPLETGCSYYYCRRLYSYYRCCLHGVARSVQPRADKCSVLSSLETPKSSLSDTAEMEVAVCTAPSSLIHLSDGLSVHLSKVFSVFWSSELIGALCFNSFSSLFTFCALLVHLIVSSTKLVQL